MNSVTASMDRHLHCEMYI